MSMSGCVTHNQNDSLMERSMFICFSVSPERTAERYGIEDRERELVCTSGLRHNSRQAEMPLPSFTQQLRTGKCTECHSLEIRV